MKKALKLIERTKKTYGIVHDRQSNKNMYFSEFSSNVGANGSERPKNRMKLNILVERQATVYGLNKA
jgi:hypothetical protein